MSGRPWAIANWGGIFFRYLALVLALCLSVLIFPLTFGQWCSDSVAAGTEGQFATAVPRQSAPAHIPKQATLPAVPLFQDIAAEAGLSVAHVSTEQKKYILETISGGVGLFDCDNDGRLDIVVVNGSSVERFYDDAGPMDTMVTLYHQEANGKFKDITKSAGLTRRGWGMGVAVADFDNDGWLDLYVTGYGGNALYRNLGNCKFEDVTEKAGVRGDGFSTGAAWADYDRDGYVDLFVSRYVRMDTKQLDMLAGGRITCRYKGVRVHCGPWGMEGESDLLFHNRGDGTFEEVSKKAGVNDSAGYYGMGVAWGDYDNDGWPDLFVANDTAPNYLYHNNHNGTFREVGLLSGVALSGSGKMQGNMGVDFGDFDHDGQLSIFVTEFAEQPNTLYKNLGDKGFSDVSWGSQLGAPSYPLVGWGTAFFDMDNDGWLDLFVANGHVFPQADGLPGSAGYREPMLLHRNKRDGTFEEVSAQAGLASVLPASRRGAAFGDIFNNGNVDIVVLNVGERPSLLLNKAKNRNHRVLFHLEGTKSNRAAIGARVTVQAGNLRQFSEVRGGSGYLSQNDLRLHFGLGSERRTDSVLVQWPSGKTEKFAHLAADFIYYIVEGAGIRGAKPLPKP